MSPGERFARALAAKDAAALAAVLAPDVDFRALTPNRAWEASSSAALVDEVLLGKWLGPSDAIEAVEPVDEEPVADRERVTYRMRVTNGDGAFVVEQVAYYVSDGDRINWLRVMCSGFRPVGAEAVG